MKRSLIAVALMTLVLGFLPVAVSAAPGGNGGTAETSVAVDPLTCEITVTATGHAISNLRLATADGNVELEAPFEGPDEVYTYVIDPADYNGLTGIWIKAGNNGKGGQGEYHAIDLSTCGQTSTDCVGYAVWWVDDFAEPPCICPDPTILVYQVSADLRFGHCVNTLVECISLTTLPEDSACKCPDTANQATLDADGSIVWVATNVDVFNPNYPDTSEFYCNPFDLPPVGY